MTPIREVKRKASTRKISGGVLTVLFCTLALFGLLIYALSETNSETNRNETLKNGPAPTRTLPLLGTNRKTSLAAFRGKIVVLNFWASWCEPCAAESAALNRIHRQLQPDQGTVLGVNFRDTSDDAKAFVRKHHVLYPNIRDVEGLLAQDYKTHKLPETFVIDRSGHIIVIARGQIDDRFLRNAVKKAAKRKSN